MNLKDREFKSCLISAPFGAELGALPRLLDETGIHWEWAKSNLVYSERLPGDLRKIVRGVDFVLGVFFGGPADGNTLFEVGLAVGIGKPVLLILADEIKMPFNLEGFPYVRASLNDTVAIGLHIDLLMRSSKRGSRYPVSGRSRAITTLAHSGLGIGKHVQHDISPGSAFEAEVARLVEEAGGRVMLHPRPLGQSQKFVPDLLLWLPSRDAELLNPAVVELKSYNITPVEMTRIEEQLLSFLGQTGVRTGLIIARGLDTESIDFRGGSSLNIFALDFERFKYLLQNNQLSDHLRQMRNRAAHGLR